MPRMPGCPQDSSPTFGDLDPVAIVLHRTYGAWGGDYSVGRNDGLFQFLIGKQDGQWVQFADTNRLCWHANGANFKAFGIELTGINEEPLTDWQAARLGDILRWASETHGIPLLYTAPDSVPAASIHVNDGNFHGVLSHVSVQTDDGSAQHTDYVSLDDYTRALEPTPTPGPPPYMEDDMAIPMFAADNLAIWRIGDTRRHVTAEEWADWTFMFKLVTGQDLKPFPFKQAVWDGVPDIATLGGASAAATHGTWTAG